LFGLAGVGKSAILRTVAQVLSEQSLLLGSFSFFRSATGPNNPDNLVATLAYQLATSIPITRPYIKKVMDENPLIFSLSLWEQAQALLISPIHQV
ncbi:hypothetical protein CPB84DRAFT_1626655, partial [Gymnopilus junonius]